MVRKITAVFLFLPLSAGLFQVAQGAEPRFEAGPYVSRIVYEEPGTMKDTGVMYGVGASAIWKARYLSLFDSFRIDAVAGRGAIDYTSSSSGSMSGVDNTMIEARALLGRDYSRSGSETVSTYTGFGYRRLTDNSGGMVSTTGKRGYDRESQYLYLPMGMAITSHSGSGWTFDGTLEYDILLKGIQKSALTQASSTTYTFRNNLTNDQYDGYGIRASARFSKRVSGSANLEFEPFVRYWNISESRSAYSLEGSSSANPSTVWYVEPANHSTEYGINLLLVF
ncbi:MAG: hypothetical protein HGB02_09330 [Chlorobiaceae bacterium]|nr:hypothetical protein [Chlorobiaceae bacterium]